MCNTDADPCKVWIESAHGARKQHTCYECSGPIPVGARYARVFTVYDGRAKVSRLHAECMWLHEFLHEVICGGEGLILLGSLGEQLHDAGPEHIDSYDEARDEYLRANLDDLLPWIAEQYRAMAETAP